MGLIGFGEAPTFFFHPASGFAVVDPDPRRDPKTRSLKGVPIKYPLILVARVPN